VEDIPALVQTFVKKLAKSMNSHVNGITPEALDLLKKYRWPGNIRELENAVERAFILESSSFITAESLPEIVKKSSGFVDSPQVMTSSIHSNHGSNVGMSPPVPTTGGLNFELFKEQAEKEFIMSALKANNGRINQTVARANIPKNTLLRKIKKYSINVKDFINDAE
jgi:two-component system, NtrC family, response regulator AtoC